MSKVLNVPYFLQRDNLLYPSGTCNVTSVAMCMAFFQETALQLGNGQLEDYLTQYCLDNELSRHSPGDLVILAQRHGFRPRFDSRAKWDEVKKWIDSGKPCIVHGYFTNYGHILVITGYSEKGWIVHDPWGEWWPYGYDTSVSGEALTYSYKMMSDKCGPDANGELWIHFFDGSSEDKRVWKPGELGGWRLQDIYERKLQVSLADVKKDVGLIKQVQICLTRFPQFQPGTADGSWGPVTQKAFENLAHAFQLGAGAIDSKTAKVLIEGKYR